MATAGASVALQLAKVGIGIVTGIFSGMAERARQATSENQALNEFVAGVDQAIKQVASDYNSGQISQNDAEAEIASIWSWYGQVVTPHIQPNRNGCASGSNCPGTATQYASTNGVPNGFCSGNEGASCCVGCGPIRLALENMSHALQAGKGTFTVPKVWGDHYGLQTREAYTISLNPPPLNNVTATVNSTIDNILGVSSPVVASGPASNAGFTGPTSQSNLLIVIVVLVALLLFGVGGRA